MKEKPGTEVVHGRYFSFRKSWAFPRDIAETVGKWVSREPRPILHVFNGSSAIGDLHVDVDHRHHRHVADAQDVKASAEKLPFKDGSIPTMIADPPWATNPRQRAVFTKEFERVIRVGGRLYLNAPWVPRPQRWAVEAVWVVYPRWGLYNNATLWTICTKREEKWKPSISPSSD